MSKGEIGKVLKEKRMKIKTKISSNGNVVTFDTGNCAGGCKLADYH